MLKDSNNNKEKKAEKDAPTPQTTRTTIRVEPALNSAHNNIITKNSTPSVEAVSNTAYNDNVFAKNSTPSVEPALGNAYNNNNTLDRNFTPAVEPALANAYSNDILAKNLRISDRKHHPLADVVENRTFAASQMKGEYFPGLTLNVDTDTTAVGCKIYQSPGPTQCSKLKVFRPKTATKIDNKENEHARQRPKTTSSIQQRAKPLREMDLAIYWDVCDGQEYKSRIGGSPKPVAGLAPLDEKKADGEVLQSGRTSTACLGDAKLLNGGPEVVIHQGDEEGTLSSNPGTPKYVGSEGKGIPNSVPATPKCAGNEGKVTKERNNGNFPNSVPGTPKKIVDSTASLPANSPIEDKELRRSVSSVPIKPESERKNLLQPSCRPCLSKRSQQGSEIKKPENAKHGLKLDKCYRSAPDLRHLNPSRTSKIAAKCRKIDLPERDDRTKGFQSGTYKMAFKAGKLNNFNINDELLERIEKSRNLRIPKPRTPFAKKSYSIRTLMPPFSIWPQVTGYDYPDHWRLVSIYQHSYKPLEARKTPFMKTVFQ